ncbi:hypothetical protein I3760_11G188100 [Carya illinoinensis]|uniref:Uncharacterized protein n=1 Tax=Carya illinoinensis TaxID=32201 RepID=A0A8T1P5Z7_CARIL|nr:uncharacterized protein LOC122280909 [Carya illinoinensis]KAG2682369.1 hypothetical protein I3760_11G188100 [Carya illinoinensis]KAG6637668.1 hypothetical protein CIPAW_11G193700 [Carya illinoinensis]KAG6689770.1 hypothetical protein I3842_11G190900 [Carya illinoinensis]
MGGHLFPMINTSLRSSVFLAKPLTAYVYKSVKSYSQASCKESHIRESADQERAPSTALEFKKIAEEKLRETEQGVASQTAFDAMEEATLGDTKLESVKRRSEEHDDGADYRRRGNEEPPEGVKAF